MKCNKATTLKRIQEIYQMMCQGASSVDIVEYGRENWKVKQAGVYKLIKVAFKYISDCSIKDINEMKFEANIRFDKLYTKLYKEGKYRDAGYIQSQKNKINGLEVQRIDLTTKGESLNNIPEEELDKLIQEKLKLLNANEQPESKN